MQQSYKHKQNSQHECTSVLKIFLARLLALTAVGVCLVQLDYLLDKSVVAAAAILFLQLRVV